MRSIRVYLIALTTKRLTLIRSLFRDSAGVSFICSNLARILQEEKIDTQT